MHLRRPGARSAHAVAPRAELQRIGLAGVREVANPPRSVA